MKTGEALLWDLDGTLVDSEPVHFLALSDALRQAGVAAPPELERTLLGTAPAEAYAYCVEALGLAVTLEELNALKVAAYARHARLLRPRREALELFRRFRARRVARPSCPTRRG